MPSQKLRPVQKSAPGLIGSHTERDDSPPVQKTHKEEWITYPSFLNSEEEGHHALGRDATFSWSRALTHPPRCNRTRHRKVRRSNGDHLGGAHTTSDF